MHCPLDHKILKEFSFDTVVLDVCEVCAGIWLGADEFKKIVTGFIQGENPQTFQFGDAHSLKEATEHYWQEDGLPCPLGHGTMQKFDYAGDSKIHLDQCTVCDGFWLDGRDVVRLWEYCKPNQGEAVLGRFMIQSMNDAEAAQQKSASFVAGLGAVSSLQEFGLFWCAPCWANSSNICRGRQSVDFILEPAYTPLGSVRGMTPIQDVACDPYRAPSERTRSLPSLFCPVQVKIGGVLKRQGSNGMFLGGRVTPLMSCGIRYPRPVVRKRCPGSDSARDFLTQAVHGLHADD